MKIAGKVAVVTGAGGGIGFATAAALVRRGAAAVAMVDVSEACADAAAQLTTINTAVLPFQGDVADAAFREHVFETLGERFGGVHICIPSAGIIDDGLAVKAAPKDGEVALYAEDRFRRVLEVNVVHPTYWAMETIAATARQRQSAGLGKWQADEGVQGVNILVGSVSSRGNRGQVAYAGSKSALTGIAATLNLEGLFYGVQTKIIHPGFVDTAMVDSIDAEYFETHLKPLIGLGRKIQPDEIADIICAMIENPVLSGGVWADAGLRPLA